MGTHGTRSAGPGSHRPVTVLRTVRGPAGVKPARQQAAATDDGTIWISERLVRGRVGGAL
jgi:hypothetical protein